MRRAVHEDWLFSTPGDSTVCPGLRTPAVEQTNVCQDSRFIIQGSISEVLWSGMGHDEIKPHPSSSRGPAGSHLVLSLPPNSPPVGKALMGAPHLYASILSRIKYLCLVCFSVADLFWACRIRWVQHTWDPSLANWGDKQVTKGDLYANACKFKVYSGLSEKGRQWVLWWRQLLGAGRSKVG